MCSFETVIYIYIIHLQYIHYTFFRKSKVEREREGGGRERGREEVEGRERKRGEESETYTERQN